MTPYRPRVSDVSCRPRPERSDSCARDECYWSCAGTLGKFSVARGQFSVARGQWFAQMCDCTRIGVEFVGDPAGDPSAVPPHCCCDKSLSIAAAVFYFILFSRFFLCAIWAAFSALAMISTPQEGGNCSRTAQGPQSAAAEDARGGRLSNVFSKTSVLGFPPYYNGVMIMTEFNWKRT